MISVKVKDMKCIKQVDTIKVNFLKISPMVKVLTFGPMEKSSRVSGLKPRNKALESGNESRATVTLANGKTICRMDTEFITGPTVINTKENGDTL